MKIRNKQMECALYRLLIRTKKIKKNNYKKYSKKYIKNFLIYIC